MTDWTWETDRFDWEAVDGKLLLPPELLAGLEWHGMWTFGGNGVMRFWAREIHPDQNGAPMRAGAMAVAVPGQIELSGVVIDMSERQQVTDKGGRKRQIVISKRSFRRMVRLVGAGLAAWPYSHTEAADGP